MSPVNYITNYHARIGKKVSKGIGGGKEESGVPTSRFEENEKSSEK